MVLEVRIRPRARRQSAKIRLRCAGRGGGRRPEGIASAADSRFSMGCGPIFYGQNLFEESSNDWLAIVAFSS